MKRLSVILLSFLLYLPLCAQFKGTVYVDINQSGTFDKGDKPLEGVMVTDGMNVVKTDRKGRFSLSGFEKTRFISITTPAGFETQQFYLPVKEDRKSYDFIVTESERTKGREHSFIHITDTEVTGGMGRWAGKTHYTFSFIFYTFILHEYRLFILLIRYLSFIYNII